jgi:hypothetical protein
MIAAWGAMSGGQVMRLREKEIKTAAHMQPQLSTYQCSLALLLQPTRSGYRRTYSPLSFSSSARLIAVYSSATQPPLDQDSRLQKDLPLQLSSASPNSIFAFSM